MPPELALEPALEGRGPVGSYLFITPVLPRMGPKPCMLSDTEREPEEVEVPPPQGGLHSMITQCPSQAILSLGGETQLLPSESF